MPNKFQTLTIILIANLLAGVGWYWHLRTRSPLFQGNEKQDVGSANQSLTIEPRDASCDIFEEVTSPNFVFTVTNTSVLFYQRLSAAKN
jgi:hypothetical protein